jgi:hypothetical protein
LSWINHIIEGNNGAPSLVITLSCAEYQWAVIFDLLNDRLILAGGAPLDPDSMNDRIKACNDYSHVIQEYVQARAEVFTISQKTFLVLTTIICSSNLPSRVAKSMIAYCAYSENLLWLKTSAPVHIVSSAVVRINPSVSTNGCAMYLD